MVSPKDRPHAAPIKTGEGSGIWSGEINAADAEPIRGHVIDCEAFVAIPNSGLSDRGSRLRSPY